MAGMSAPAPYLSETEAPTRAEVDALSGLTLLEFGTDWCGHCRAVAGRQAGGPLRDERSAGRLTATMGLARQGRAA